MVAFLVGNTASLNCAHVVMSQNFLADPVHNDLVLPLRVCQCREDFGKKIVQFVQFLLNVTFRICNVNIALSSPVRASLLAPIESRSILA